jgi:serine/threonine-protein kinase RsbW
MNNIINKISDKITIKADLTELDRVRSFIQNASLSLGFDAITSNLIALAVEEACTNLFKHSYNFDKSKEVSITLSADSKGLEILIEDDGPSFDPTKLLPIDAEKIHKNLKKGGLGIFLISKVMDKIYYFPKDNTNIRNRLILFKNFV